MPEGAGALAFAVDQMRFMQQDHGLALCLPKLCAEACHTLGEDVDERILLALTAAAQEHMLGIVECAALCMIHDRGSLEFQLRARDVELALARGDRRHEPQNVDAGAPGSAVEAMGAAPEPCDDDDEADLFPNLGKVPSALGFVLGITQYG